MLIMAVDVGIKNLAYCVARIDSGSQASPTMQLTIQRWSNVDMTQDAAAHERPERLRCVTCGKLAKASASFGVVCTRHVPKDKPLIIDETTGRPIKLLKRAPIQALLATKGLKTTGSLRALLERAAEVATLPLIPVKTPTARHFATSTNRLHDAIRRWIERDWDDLRHVTGVYIEHQPVMKNPTMKTVQLLVYATLRERLLAARPSDGHSVAFYLTHASTKVKGCASAGDAGYQSRKAFSQSRVLRFLETAPVDTDNHAWLRWLLQQKKTDDLSDALCMLMDVAQRETANTPSSTEASC